MSKSVRELLDEFLDEHHVQLQLKLNSRTSFFSGIEEDLKLFITSAQEFAQTGQLDSEVLGTDLKKLNLDEPGAAKKGSRRKKPNLMEIPEEAQNGTDIPKENIKIEKKDMPAPNFLPPRLRPKEVKVEKATVRTTRTKGKKANSRDSDVVIENPRITTINLLDTDESDSTNMRNTRSKARKKLSTTESTVEVSRTTRTKTRKQAAQAAEQEVKSGKRNSSESRNEEEPISNKKAKKSTSPQANATGQTMYEDAQTTLSEPLKEKQLNSTYVASKVNSTVVVENPKFNIFDKKSHNDLFTDDESSTELNSSPKKAPIPTTTTKQMFSPYDKTSMKKKVEAFEKLHNNDREATIKANKSTRGTPCSVKEKVKMFTPSGLQFLPASSSTSKLNKLLNKQRSSNTPSQSDSVLSVKSAQKDPREHQRKLYEREQALKKKEAMLLAQAEAKRKQNEEKQLKAQQQRKALEAERLKHLETQKQKEEKLKQRELEREENLQKQKQELEKKRQAQKKKLLEIQAQKQQAEEAKSRPLYMTTKLPPLPTDDCYDSDDSHYKKPEVPGWCRSEHTKIIQLSMLTAGEKIKNTLFCRRAQTPDLSDIFEAIDPRKLKRSSSILWKKPPRYTMMPDLNETRFSEDEELYDSD